jgi:hypothetical protein
MLPTWAREKVCVIPICCHSHRGHRGRRDGTRE